MTRTDEWEPWLLFMLEGVETTASWTTAKINAIRRLEDHTAEVVRQGTPKIYSRELVDVIFQQPYCRISNLEAEGIAKRQTASKYLKALASWASSKSTSPAARSSSSTPSSCAC